MYHMMQAWIFGIYCGWLHSLHVQIKACALRIGLLQVHVLHNLVPMFLIQVLPRTYATQIFVFPTPLMFCDCQIVATAKLCWHVGSSCAKNLNACNQYVPPCIFVCVSLFLNYTSGFWFRCTFNSWWKRRRCSVSGINPWIPGCCAHSFRR